MKKLLILLTTFLSFNTLALTKINYTFPTGESVEISKIMIKLDNSSRYILNKSLDVMTGMQFVRSSSVEFIDGEKCIVAKGKKVGQIGIMSGDIDSKLIFCSDYIEFESKGYRRAFIYWSNDIVKGTEFIEDIEYSDFLSLIREHLEIDNRGTSYKVNKNENSVIKCKEGYIAKLLAPYEVLCSIPAILGDRYTPQTEQSCARKYVWSTDRLAKSETCLKINSIEENYITTQDRECVAGFMKKEITIDQPVTIMCVRE